MKFFVNISSHDDTYVNHPTNFLEIASNDYFIFSVGSADVADGKSIPTSEQLNQAMTILPGSGESVIAKIFIADITANVIREILLAGQNSNLYVFCVSFDLPTATEPILELWDDTNYNTYIFQMLGSNTPNNSNIKGRVTTGGILGTIKPLAGALDINRLLLNNSSGKVVAAKDLYFNMYAKVQSTFTTSFENPRFLIKYYETP